MPHHAGAPAGHSVTAVVRDPARLAVPAHPRLEVVTADVLDPASICPAVDGADAVLTAVAPPGTGPSTLRQDSTRSIIQAMQKTGGRRRLAVSGSIVADHGESPYLRYLLKPLARRTFLRHVCADFHGAEDEIHASDLDWTIFRPPRSPANPPGEPTAPRPAATCHTASASPAPTSPPACSRCSTTRPPCTSTSASPADTSYRDCRRAEAESALPGGPSRTAIRPAHAGR